MNVLLIHNGYILPGGEDVVCTQEAALLRGRGHVVEEMLFSNRPMALARTISLAVAAFWSREAIAKADELLKRFRPEIMHCHNIYPLVSPAIFRWAKRHGIASVQTLHNYRLFCPNGTLHRNGAFCHDCLGKPIAWPGIIHRCYRHSAAASLHSASVMQMHWVLDTWKTKVDRYLCLSEFARAQFIRAGLPPQKLTVKPNFVALPTLSERSRSGALYVGRLEPAKGVELLLDAWSPELPHLNICGDGPLEDRLRSSYRAENICFLGRLPRPRVLELMLEHAILVFPSRSTEGFPMVVAEAMSTGMAVVASNVPAVPEMIEDGTSGLLFQSGDGQDLRQKVLALAADRSKARALGDAARTRVSRYYSADRSYISLMGAYQAAIENVEPAVA